MTLQFQNSICIIVCLGGFETDGACLFAFLSVCAPVSACLSSLSVCLFVCLYVCLSGCLVLYMSMCRYENMSICRSVDLGLQHARH